MAEIPAKLARLRDRLKNLDRSQRIQMLIDLGGHYAEVPAEIASPPYDETRKVPACESEAYVWATEADDSIKYHFYIGNPQGVSAKATAAIIDRTCSGAPLDQIVAISPDIVYELFGGELSVAKNMGLTNMLEMCRQEAKMRLAEGKAS